MNTETLLEELEGLTHVARVARVVALGRAARTGDARAARALSGLAEGDAYARRLAVKACFGSGDGALVVRSLADDSAVVRAAALGAVPHACDDAQALAALRAAAAVRRTLPLLHALRKHRRLLPIDAYLDEQAASPGALGFADELGFGSAAAVTRHLGRALERPSAWLWPRLGRWHAAACAEHLCARLAEGRGHPGNDVAAALARALPPMIEADPEAALRVVGALLRRGAGVDPAMVRRLARRAPEPTWALLEAAAHPVTEAIFAGSAGRLSPARLASLVASRRRALGEPRAWLGRLSEEGRRAVVDAWAEGIGQDPRWGGELVRWLDQLPEAEQERVYRLWSTAQQDAEGVVPSALVRLLPETHRAREARRHLDQVHALATRPHIRFAYAAFLPWEEAERMLRDHLGHPEGELRAGALAALLAIPGRMPEGPERRARVDEALKRVRARKFEQDPVRQAMLRTLAGWPIAAWRATHLPDVGAIVRDALDAADLSVTTASIAERLVVRLFRLDGPWGAQWLETLLRERGQLHDLRLGERLGDAEVDTLAPALGRVARILSARERVPSLCQLAEGLGPRLVRVPELVAALEQVSAGSATAIEAAWCAAVLARHAPERCEALVAREGARWVKRGWRQVVLAIARVLKRLSPAVVAAVEAVIEDTPYESEAAEAFRLLRLRSSALPEVAPRQLARDRSLVALAEVHLFLHRHRQDLLTPFLDGRPMRGRFATGRTAWVLPFTDGFWRWTPHQQALFERALTGVASDRERDTPAVFYALLRLPRLTWLDGQVLARFADDERAAVQERAVRLLGRCDAGQGVPKLLVCLDDGRARWAVYSLRRAVLGPPPDVGLALLRRVPLQKVTVAKEVLRLMGELRSDAAFAALLALDTPALHRDVRVALLRALWNHLDRPETWDVYQRAVTGPDWVLASRLADVPADLLTVETDRRLAKLLTLVLARPEPEARVDLLRRAALLPVRDADRVFWQACLGRLASPYPDERTAAAYALTRRTAESDGPRLRAALATIRADRRAVLALLQVLDGYRPWLATVTTHMYAALAATLADDPAAAPLHLRAVHAAEGTAALTGAVAALAERGALDFDAIAAARAELEKLREPEMDALEALEAKLAAHPVAAARRVALAALVLAAGQGWTPARRERLARMQTDPDPGLAGAAQLVFPPEESPPPE